MTQDVRFGDAPSVLAEFDYPVDRTMVAEELSEVTLLLADGEANFGDLVSRTSSDTYDTVDELMTEIHNVLPREAVGEPYQSEGEG